MKSFVDKLLSGNKEAFMLFYQKYNSKILPYVKSKVARKEDAEELMHDILLEAIDSLPLLKKEENLQAWVYKITQNKIVDFYRKRKIKSILLSQVPFLELVASETHQPEFIYEKEI